MATVKVYNFEGKEVEEMELNDSVFALSANDDLIHQVMVSIESNGRQVLADTKTRGERAGSGIKPWKQKGTGRARVGSVRTPVWRKGGVVFGPNSERNFKKKINKKMNVKAIAMVLSGKLKDGEIIVLDKIEAKEMKTKQMAQLFKNLKVKGKTLVSLSGEEKEYYRAFRNLEGVDCMATDQLNVVEMLSKKNLIMSKQSIGSLNEKYAK